MEALELRDTANVFVSAFNRCISFRFWKWNGLSQVV